MGGKQIHSTNGEIIQAKKKRDTTSTETGKIKEKMGLAAKKKSVWGVVSNREVLFQIIFF